MNRHVRPDGTHRHTDVTRGQSRRVVDTITDYRDNGASLLEGLHHIRLLLRQAAGIDLGDANLTRDHISDLLVITGHHAAMLHAQFTQFLDRLAGDLADGIV